MNIKKALRPQTRVVNMTNKTTPTQVRLTDMQLDYLRNMVEVGLCLSVSDAIRVCIRDKFRESLTLPERKSNRGGKICL